MKEIKININSAEFLNELLNDCIMYEIWPIYIIINDIIIQSIFEFTINKIRSI